MPVNYAKAYWTPPMTPKLAFDLESGQIEKLDLAPMVSLTDHDNIKAPMLLRTVPSARQIPVSVEWSAPYGVQSFHLGIHNLPSASRNWCASLHAMRKPPETRPRPINCTNPTPKRITIGAVPPGQSSHSGRDTPFRSG